MGPGGTRTLPGARLRWRPGAKCEAFGLLSSFFFGGGGVSK